MGGIAENKRKRQRARRGRIQAEIRAFGGRTRKAQQAFEKAQAEGVEWLELGERVHLEFPPPEAFSPPLKRGWPPSFEGTLICAGGKANWTVRRDDGAEFGVPREWISKAK